MKKDALRVMVAGGGTGGHLFPGIAVAEALCAKFSGSQVVFIGTHRKIDTTSLEKYGFQVRSIHSYGIKGKSVPQLVKALVVLPLSLLQALTIILRFRPHVVIGVGGYVTGPVMLAAKILGKVTIIHEQNSIPGLANRKLGKLVKRVCLSLPGSEKFFNPEKTVITGNPVRREILNLATTEMEKNVGAQTILILGGSQGARQVNRLAVEVFSTKNSLSSLDINIIHQTGSGDFEEVQKRYKEAGVQAKVGSFFHNMDEMYQQADLVISRAGATTLAELAVLGKPAILIPYPYAADNHQEKNGEFYVQGGGAIMFIEKELTAEILCEALRNVVISEKDLKEMGSNMRRLAFPDASEKIVEVCLQQLGSDFLPTR